MDRLIEDYEKALTEEFELRESVERIQEHIKVVETETMVRGILNDPKSPQWQAHEYARVHLDHDEQHHAREMALKDAERDYGYAKIRLAVVTERLELTKARLYGGHYEMLDLQKVEQVDYETLA